MLVLGSELLNLPVLSLHVGGEIARTAEAIVDPKKLKLCAYKLQGALLGGEHGDLLETDDIREYSKRGMIVDSIDVFASSGEVIHLDEIINLNFSLIGLKVVSEEGKTLGKVINYTVDSDSFMVYQLIVRRPAIKALMDPELTINRSQIIEIDDYKVTIKNESEEVKITEKVEEFRPNFVNPFREPHFSPIRNQSPDEQDIE